MEEREKVIAPLAKTTTTTISVRKLPFLVRKILQECERDGIIEGYLDLSIQGINDDMMEELCLWLVKFHGQVKDLYLNDNKISSSGAILLFDTLRKTHSMISLIQLSTNQLDDTCISSLVDYIQKNQFISKIHLGSSNITDKGMEMFSDLLIGNTTLKKLDVGGSKGITDKSFQYLEILATNTCMSAIGMVGTGVGSDHQQAILAKLDIPMDERIVPIMSNTKSASKKL